MLAVRTVAWCVQHAAGDGVTLRVEGGTAVRVRLAQPPPGAAAPLAMVSRNLLPMFDGCAPDVFHDPTPETYNYIICAIIAGRAA